MHQPPSFAYSRLSVAGRHLVITNSYLSDIHWLQASLQMRDGGLGIRRVSSLALSAFLASAANTRDLQDPMLFACNVGLDTVVASARDTWSSLNALPCPSDTDARRQRSWDETNVTRDVQAIWEGASSEMDKARRLASKAVICATNHRLRPTPIRRSHPSRRWSALGLEHL